MLSFIARRIASYIAMLFIATSGVYFLASAFLDPRSNYLQMRPVPPKSSIDASLTFAGVNDETPLIQRYWSWLEKIVLHWNWGYTPQGEAINSEVWHRGWVSLQLVLPATIITALLGVAVGVYTAIRKYKAADRTWNVVSVFFLVTPTFVLALLLALAYLQTQQKMGVHFLYVTGWGGPGVVNYLKHAALPVLSLVLAGYAGYHFTQRTYLLDTLNADYVRTARAKGLRKNVAIRRHALRPSLIPTAFNIALNVALAVTGAVFIEQIFSIRGAGLYFIQTINQNDINGAVAVAFLGGVATCIGLTLADVLIAMLDPRIRIS